MFATALIAGLSALAPAPADLSANITNPWWPMRPGSRWVYRETEPDGETQRVVVTVTNRTRLIANGARARVVRDVVTQDGEPVEVTQDWYAQDRRGNVWYLGERTTEYEDGRPVSTEGSFEAGVDGARAGIAMPAHPRRGMRYRQEFYRGHAEDRARVLEVGKRVLVTRDVNPLARPREVELKFYERGIGPVLVAGLTGGLSTERLVRYRRGPRS